ncbi:hypothetical protein Echvi_3995 [Echinicola vietnamensis DSM 17526]|uniref:Uncharacterized protein n=1 Tax=Echinicola vietnamensis (strain DSM 17526 / LMG 23754 / KMM 6221) TaxID=926556 RepID=L0G3U5_ECHVK|nr:hypothetical protein Echvi_3995 [Echinicola vietnamensis DSM 17526]
MNVCHETSVIGYFTPANNYSTLYTAVKIG